MDRIIKITLGLFIAIIVVTVALAGYTMYTATAYQSSLTSSYAYSCSITTDSALTNITLYLPIPAEKGGSSPIVSRFSAHTMPGIPGSWQTTLFDTGKATVAKIIIPALVPPAGTTADKPYTFTISADLRSDKVIDTLSPFENSAVFRPASDIQKVSCTAAVLEQGGSPACSTYLTALYADYTTDPNARVTITSSVTGRNTWRIFESRSNEYKSDISLLMLGENHGWATAQGSMQSGIGSYEAPFHIP